MDKQNYEREMSAYKKTESFKATKQRKKKNQGNHSGQQSSPLDMNISGANSSFVGSHVGMGGNLPGSSAMNMMNRPAHMNHDSGMEIPIFTEEFLDHNKGWFAYTPFSLHFCF